MRLIFIKDTHLRPSNLKHPSGRTDTYYLDIENKLKYVTDYARQNKIKHILCAGDIFDIKAKSKYNLESILYLDNLLSKNFKDLELISIPGNHDLPNSNRDSFDESLYGYFANQRKLINDISNSPKVLDDCVIYGIPFTPDLDLLRTEIENANDDLFQYEGKASILLLHEHLIPDNETFIGKFLKYSEVLSLANNFDIICGGHIHKGFKVYKKGHQQIINPWSFTRLVRDTYAMSDEHTPEFVVIDTESLEVFTIEIPHKDFDNSFIKSILATETSYKGAINNFIHSVVEFKNSTDNITVPEKIKARIYAYLELAEAELN